MRPSLPHKGGGQGPIGSAPYEDPLARGMRQARPGPALVNLLFSPSSFHTCRDESDFRIVDVDPVSASVVVRIRHNAIHGFARHMVLLRELRYFPPARLETDVDEQMSRSVCCIHHLDGVTAYRFPYRQELTSAEEQLEVQEAEESKQRDIKLGEVRETQAIASSYRFRVIPGLIHGLPCGLVASSMPVSIGLCPCLPCISSR